MQPGVRSLDAVVGLYERVEGREGTKGKETEAGKSLAQPSGTS